MDKILYKKAIESQNEWARKCFVRRFKEISEAIKNNTISPELGYYELFLAIESYAKSDKDGYYAEVISAELIKATTGYDIAITEDLNQEVKPTLAPQ